MSSAALDHGGNGSADNFHKGVQTVLEAMLQSPNFIYRAEL